MKLTMLFSALLAGMLTMTSALAADNVHFSGALVAEPCTLPDADTNIQVDFGTVIVKYLYQYQRTKSEPFTIHLEDCDPSVMKTVSVTFEGTADDELTSMLALDPVSTAKGIAIGLAKADGTSLKLNEAGSYEALSVGNNSLKFNAYVMAKPTAIATNNVVAGSFQALSLFVLNYA